MFKPPRRDGEGETTQLGKLGIEGIENMAFQFVRVRDKWVFRFLDPLPTNLVVFLLDFH